MRLRSLVVMLSAHFDDVTDDISRLRKLIWAKYLQELPKSPTLNIIANYENTEQYTNITRISGANHDVTRASPEFWTIPKFLNYREQIAISIVKVGG